jgi:hypothetical protein
MSEAERRRVIGYGAARGTRLKMPESRSDCTRKLRRHLPCVTRRKRIPGGE